MTSDSTTRRLAVTILGSMLVVAACGDDGGSSSPDDVSDPVATDGAVDGDTDADAPPGPVGAVFKIGDEEYVFTDEDACISTVRAMTAAFTDGPDIRVEVDLPPYDWDTDTVSSWGPPEVDLTDRGGEGRRSYLASTESGDRYPDTDAGQAVIDTYELGDGWATGSGQVIDTQALVNAEAGGTEPPPLLPLTFEIVCEP